jgi:hypothetical protein
LHSPQPLSLPLLASQPLPLPLLASLPTTGTTRCTWKNTIIASVVSACFFFLATTTLPTSYFNYVNDPPYDHMLQPNRDNSNHLLSNGHVVKHSCEVGLPPKGISGYFNLPGTSLSYFYYFAAARNVQVRDAPLVIWMSGGPGCSSLLAAMMENGPCRAYADPKTGEPLGGENAYAWNQNANVLFIDQPADVGLSYGGDGNSTLMYSHDQVASNMLAFLHRWEERFPLSHNGKLFIFAESFGGHYVS